MARQRMSVTDLAWSLTAYSDHCPLSIPTMMRVFLILALINFTELNRPVELIAVSLKFIRLKRNRGKLLLRNFWISETFAFGLPSSLSEGFVVLVTPLLSWWIPSATVSSAGRRGCSPE